MKQIIGIVVVVLLAALGWWMFASKQAVKEYSEYYIELPGPNGKVYFQDLKGELKTTDDLSKAKRFDKRDGDLWYGAIQQHLAIKHTPPDTRKAVKMVGVE
jgi:hypothetical protein